MGIWGFGKKVKLFFVFCCHDLLNLIYSDSLLWWQPEQPDMLILWEKYDNMLQLEKEEAKTLEIKAKVCNYFFL